MEAFKLSLFFFFKLIKRVEAKIFLGDLSIINMPIVVNTS